MPGIKPEQQTHCEADLDTIVQALNALNPMGRLPWPAAKDVLVAHQKDPQALSRLFGSHESLARIESLLTTDAADAIKAFFSREMQWLAKTYRYDRCIQSVYNWVYAVCSTITVGKWLSWLPGPLWNWPRRLRREWKLIRARIRRKLRRSMGIDDLLTLCGVDHRRLLVLKDQAVQVPDCLRGLHRNDEHNCETGYLLGLDLIVAEDGIYVLEANLNGAVRADRSDFYDVDPIATNIMTYAAAGGFGDVRYVASDWVRVSTFLAASFQRAAATHPVNWLIYQDGRRGAPPHEQKWLRSEAAIPPDTASNCLTVRHKKFAHGSDFLITDKFCLNYLLADEKTLSNARHYVVPEMTAMPVIDPKLLRIGLPNLVYKYPHLNVGQGVYFLRATSVEEALSYAAQIDAENNAPRPGLFQRFICSKLLEGRRMFDVRANIFVSPVTTVFCGALRKESHHPIEHLSAMGIVEDKRPFIMNRAFGNDFSDIGEEADVVEAAASEIGDTLRCAIENRFEIRTGKSRAALNGRRS